jgi:hypothetical protein
MVGSDPGENESTTAKTGGDSGRWECESRSSPRLFPDPRPVCPRLVLSPSRAKAGDTDCSDDDGELPGNGVPYEAPHSICFC